MDDKFLDFFKSFDPKLISTLENLNITKIIKQLEQLKLSGLLERLEDLNKLTKLLKQMDDLKLSELVKKVEDVKLSSIIKQIEENKLMDIIDVQNPLKLLKNDSVFSSNAIRIENRQDSIPDLILKLAELKKMNLITEEEFNTKKKDLLARL